MKMDLYTFRENVHVHTFWPTLKWTCTLLYNHFSILTIPAVILRSNVITLAILQSLHYGLRHVQDLPNKKIVHVGLNHTLYDGHLYSNSILFTLPYNNILSEQLSVHPNKKQTTFRSLCHIIHIKHFFFLFFFFFFLFLPSPFAHPTWDIRN